VLAVVQLGGGMHETFEKQIHFEEHKEAVINALGNKAIGVRSENHTENNNKHVLKSNYFTIEIQILQRKDLNKIFAEVAKRFFSPRLTILSVVFEET
jgi:hypothetical protein